MKILVIVGNCLNTNSSANLCHLSYINGLLQAGHTVDLVAVSSKNLNIDDKMQLPKVECVAEFDASLYEQLGAKKKHSTVAEPNIHAKSIAFSSPAPHQSVKAKIKSRIRKLYGVYGTDIIWYQRAKKFRSNTKYNYVISLAYPPVSHYLAEKLLEKKRIRADRWIQIWEDPWYADLLGFSHTETVRKEEQRLLIKADRVCYVSPLTLMYQQEAFPASKEKMYWQPLPSYYKDSKTSADFSELVFGYFGDYTSTVRNLRPFYNVVTEQRLNTYICGYSDCHFASTDSVEIHPRMQLSELKTYEDAANVLVFLCNLRGGQIPGKIYQYSATSKMILFILDGTETEQDALKQYFEPFGRYVFCQNTESSIKKAIQTLQECASDESYHRPLDYFEPSKIIGRILEG